jgi:hypothetical protein
MQDESQELNAENEVNPKQDQSAAPAELPDPQKETSNINIQASGSITIGGDVVGGDKVVHQPTYVTNRIDASVPLAIGASLASGAVGAIIAANVMKSDAGSAESSEGQNAEAMRAMLDDLNRKPASTSSRLSNEAAYPTSVSVYYYNATTGELVHSEQLDIPGCGSVIVSPHNSPLPCGNYNMEISSSQQLSAVTLFDVFALPDPLNLRSGTEVFFRIHTGYMELDFDIQQLHLGLRQAPGGPILADHLRHRLTRDSVLIEKNDLVQAISTHNVSSPAYLELRFELLMKLRPDLLDQAAAHMHTSTGSLTLQAETLPKTIGLIW